MGLFVGWVTLRWTGGGCSRRRRLSDARTPPPTVAPAAWWWSRRRTARGCAAPCVGCATSGCPVTPPTSLSRRRRRHRHRRRRRGPSALRRAWGARAREKRARFRRSRQAAPGAARRLQGAPGVCRRVSPAWRPPWTRVLVAPRRRRPHNKTSRGELTLDSYQRVLPTPNLHHTSSKRLQSPTWRFIIENFASRRSVQLRLLRASD